MVALNLLCSHSGSACTVTYVCVCVWMRQGGHVWERNIFFAVCVCACVRVCVCGCVFTIVVSSLASEAPVTFAAIPDAHGGWELRWVPVMSS